MSKHKPKIIVLVGPTASGKSDLAVHLAKKFNGEIISADSRQVYRGLNLGTGKITKREMCGVPHHLLDVVPPRQIFTVAHYQKLGKIAIKKILKRGKLPIIVGGTGQYVNALVNNSVLPAVKPDLKLRLRLDKLTAAVLFKRLQKLDPRRASNIDRHNKRRLVRALEIIEVTGKPVPKTESSIKYQVLSIGIKKSDQELKNLIHGRLRARIRKGLVKEVEKLHSSGLSWQRLDDLGLEYRWISRYLQNLMTKPEMLEKLETEIWRYSKRQMTWFKRDQDIRWVNKKDQALRLVKKFTSSS